MKRSCWWEISKWKVIYTHFQSENPQWMHVSEEKLVVAWKQELSTPREQFWASRSVGSEENKLAISHEENLLDLENAMQGVLLDPHQTVVKILTWNTLSTLWTQEIPWAAESTEGTMGVSHQNMLAMLVSYRITKKGAISSVHSPSIYRRDLFHWKQCSLQKATGAL